MDLGSDEDAEYDLAGDMDLGEDPHDAPADSTLIKQRHQSRRKSCGNATRGTLSVPSTY